VDRDAVKRLKDLKKENAWLKRLVANQQLDIPILKKNAKGKSESHASSFCSGAG